MASIVHQPKTQPSEDHFEDHFGPFLYQGAPDAKRLAPRPWTSSIAPVHGAAIPRRGGGARVGTSPDADLVRRLHKGCLEAAGELFRRHHPAMLRYAKTLTNDPAMAEDLASEAFTRTLERVTRGSLPQTLEAYLIVAVRNASVDEFRRTKRLRHLGPLDEELLNVSPGTAPVDFTMVLADRDQLRQALSLLSPRQRLVLWLTTVEGRPLVDAGAELGVNANATAALAHRARAALRQANFRTNGSRTHVPGTAFRPSTGGG